VKGGKRLPKGSTFSGVKTEHPYLRVTDFERNGLKSTNIKYINSEVQAAIKNYIIDSGDVYISIAGTIGVAGIIPEQFHKANLTENAAKFLPKQPETVHNRYFCYILNSESVQNIIKSKTMAVGVPKLALFRILEIPLNLPSLAEQKKIAEILDAADSLRQKDQQLVEHYDRLSQSLFLDMFGDPISNPKGWAIYFWENVLTIKNGKNQKKVENPDGKYPIFGSGGKVMGYADDFICEAGTIILGRKGSINNPILMNERFWNVDTAFGLCAKGELDYLYLYYFCIRYNFMKHNKATTLPSLTKADLLKIEMPLPPLALQKSFKDRVKKIEQQKELAQQSLKKSDDLFNSLLQKAFKGELTTN
jgi:type I restriction enzyme S subunit